jgi:hypothetical protein
MKAAGGGGAKQKYQLVVATRKSARGGASSTNVHLVTISMTTNSFLVLDSYGDETLEEIAQDCDVRLEEVQETLSAMKLEEKLEQPWLKPFTGIK